MKYRRVNEVQGHEGGAKDVGKFGWRCLRPEGKGVGLMRGDRRVRRLSEKVIDDGVEVGRSLKVKYRLVAGSREGSCIVLWEGCWAGRLIWRVWAWD